MTTFDPSKLSPNHARKLARTVRTALRIPIANRAAALADVRKASEGQASALEAIWNAPSDQIDTALEICDDRAANACPSGDHYVGQGGECPTWDECREFAGLVHKGIIDTDGNLLDKQGNIAKPAAQRAMRQAQALGALRPKTHPLTQLCHMCNCPVDASDDKPGCACMCHQFAPSPRIK